MNYVNEHEFVHWIKSGGYGKVYMGKNPSKIFYEVFKKKYFY